MHWWKFKALFEGLSDEATVKKYMYYRSVELSTIKDKDEERKRIEKIQRQIAIKREISDEDMALCFGVVDDEKPALKRMWAVCPHCGAKTIIYNNLQIVAVFFLKCTRGCKITEFE
jgi:DNA-directed RNA polymerase subunit M/transcription elongation factor TFIIS